MIPPDDSTTREICRGRQGQSDQNGPLSEQCRTPNAKRPGPEPIYRFGRWPLALGQCLPSSHATLSPLRSQAGQVDRPEQNESVYAFGFPFSMLAAVSSISSETSWAGSSSIWSNPIGASFMTFILLFAQWPRQIGGEIAITPPTRSIKSSAAAGVNHAVIDSAPAGIWGS